MWKYDIAAAKWSNISPPLNRAYAGITVDPGNPDRMIVSTIDYYQQPHTMGDKFFETLDGGKSWNSIVDQGVRIDANGVSWIAGSFIHWTASIEFDPFDTRTVMVVSGNGIFKSTDIHAMPAVWKFEDAGLEESVPLNMVSIPGGPAISAIGDYDGFRHADVTRYSPIHTPTMGTTWGLDYAAANPKVVARVGHGDVPVRRHGRQLEENRQPEGPAGPAGAQRGRQGYRAQPGKVYRQLLLGRRRRQLDRRQGPGWRAAGRRSSESPQVLRAGRRQDACK